MAAAQGRWRSDGRSHPVRRVLAARRTAACFGDWEYLLEWEGDHAASWEPATLLGGGAALRRDCERARLRACRPHSYRDWLQWQGRKRDRAIAAQARDLLAKCEGREEGEAVTWEAVWHDFLEYAHAVYGGEAGGAHNTRERPAAESEMGGRVGL